MRHRCLKGLDSVHLEFTVQTVPERQEGKHIVSVQARDQLLYIQNLQYNSIANKFQYQQYRIL